MAAQIANLSTFHELFAGDTIYCCTPENAGPVVKGDAMTGHVEGTCDINVKLV